MLETATVVISGLPLQSYSHEYTAQGWDLTGSVLQSSPLVDNPDGSVVALFGWNPSTQSYDPVDPFVLQPQQGYWALVFDVPSTVSVGSGSIVPMRTKNDMKAFRETYGMLPPSPPFEIASKSQSLPTEFTLSQNYPNPFLSEAKSPAYGRGNPETIIQYAIPAQIAGRVHVTLRIYNTQGQLVRTLVDEERSAGRYRVVWDGRNEAGSRVSSGVYLYKMMAGHFMVTKKLVALR
jgi:hypothetical protein